jgi:hypothetical protein
MARIRSIKPEFWEDEKLATSLSRDARLLYIGLWNFADEQARVRGSARYIKGVVFPYDDDLTSVQIDAYLSELIHAGVVVQYDVSGSSYLYLPKLGKHQRLSTEVSSRLPDPPDQQVCTNPHESEEVQTSPPSCARLCGREQVAGSRGSRTTDLTTFGPPYGAEGRDATEGSDDPNPQKIISDWIDRCRKRPPDRVIGQAAKHAAGLLDQDFDPKIIAAALDEMTTRQLHPATLDSLVHGAVNGSRASPTGATAQADEWINLGRQIDQQTGERS